MRLDLTPIMHTPGGRIPFSFQLDLSELEFYGEHPIAKPLEVTGEARNMAGALFLTAKAETELDLVCDRCVRPFQKTKTVEIHTLVAERLEDEENTDIVLMDGSFLDLDQVVTTAFILEMDTKNLCSEDCKGLCPKCGANLNDGPCNCKPEIDPRLAALTQLLNHGNS